MKKLIVALLSLTLVFGAFGLSACDNADGINIYMPDGAPALALAYMMDGKKDIDGEKINYHVAPAETIADYVRNEKADMVILPANAAVGLYNQGADYKIAATVTHGNLYLVGKNATTFEDLKGKVIATFGKNQIPDLVFKSLLKINELEPVESDTPVDGKVALLYADSPAAAKDLLAGEQVELAYLAEPVVTGTIAALSSKGVSQIFDIQEEWANAMAEDDLDYSGGFPQAVLFVKSSIKKSVVDAFLAECKEGDGWAATHAAEAVQAIKDNALSGTTSVMPSVSGAIISRCNISTVTDGLESYVGEFLTILKGYFPTTSPTPSNSNIYYTAN